VTSHLLDAGADVVLLVRNPQRVLGFAQRGAQVHLGRLEDASFVTHATRDVDALMWITPAGVKAANVREQQAACGRAAQAAIEANCIQRVVNLTSVGAQIGSGTGIIDGLHDVEDMIDQAGQDICHLRAGFFYENFLWQLNSIRNDSCICYPISGHKRLPMVASRDVAQTAVDALLDADWQGRCYCGVYGPGDLSFDDAAWRISRGIGREIKYRQIDEDNMRKIMYGWGASDSFMQAMLETYRAVQWDRLHVAEPRTAETTTPTRLAKFARETIAPLVQDPVPAVA
jgi:uncharacterized protein YbjT (DUF2867 family)